jgi:hypothetical protein
MGSAPYEEEKKKRIGTDSRWNSNASPKRARDDEC